MSYKVLNFCQPFDLSILVLLSLALASSALARIYLYISLVNNPSFSVKIDVVENFELSVKTKQNKTTKQNIYLYIQYSIEYIRTMRLMYYVEGDVKDVNN